LFSDGRIVRHGRLGWRHIVKRIAVDEIGLFSHIHSGYWGS
jgi:hypothetical protein